MKHRNFTSAVLLFFCFSFSYAQQQIPVMRYTYQVDFLRQGKDSDQSEPMQEVMYLDVVDNTSRFAPSGVVLKNEKMIEQNQANNLTMQERLDALKPFISRFPGGVVYNDSQELNTYSRSGLDYYNLKEPLDLIKWDISDQIVQINNMNAQKATGELSGRVWTVYFTQDIALQEGPYKFKNLPGFVIKASDDKGVFNFELIQASKDSTTYWLDKSSLKAMDVNKKQYTKVVKQNSNKSLSQLFQQSSGATITKVIDKDGKDVTDQTLNKKPEQNIYAIEIYDLK
ncbi:GLPGLI family protein [Myroides sp. LJL119]